MFLKDDGTPMDWPGVALGGHAVGVPGLIRMLAMAHAEHGIMAWKDLFQPAIKLAEDGFYVTPRLAGLLANDTELRTVPGTREYFYPDGEPLKEGDRLKNPALAKVLRQVALTGPDAFYVGKIAKGIAQTVSDALVNPTPMTPSDLAGYVAKKRPPVCATYRKHRVCGMGPPSSGGILVAQTLGILEHFDLSQYEPFSLEAVHLIIGASQLAFADRNFYVGDSDFIPVPVTALVDPNYLAERASHIDPDKAMQNIRPGRAGRSAWNWRASPETEKGLSTTHFTVRDQYGNIVSMTASIERAYGSKHMTQGFLLNNQLTDFSFKPTHMGHPVANAAAPQKRPRSTMSPTIVYDASGEPVLAIGSPGGSQIAGYTLKAIIGVLDWDMHVADAIATPNIVSGGGPVTLEKDSDAEALKPALEAMGHKVRIRPMTVSYTHLTLPTICSV